MKKVTRVGLIVFLFALLIAIRIFVAPYFYDPLHQYFKTEYLYSSVFEIEYRRYFLHLFLRYLLNSTVSLAILFLVFKSKNVLLFSLKFYLISFILLSLFLFIILKFNVFEGYMLLFYVRRFLIQPLFVFILLPAFYYQKIKAKK